ncbi:tail completion protein gp17 [Sulfitobacter geojensis]|uniref:DUF3168 domain-containing protein n=1 Tax=Sulfitobacter geojensis TaxID=1342299 RepID=A0AAE2VWV0_9RHOB|nr:DUF3168 domain-containing protein [Sulfitobacter geojensis]MBM1688829.1 DUF3168 domain-containing protein [Sulfitobacter geojensis]MBM1692896.1 DUF3168 domain-containing protein [Sulfitobacter geojensis]MBM1705062.1 DUF3168 domain-containing protein [Sulfitobacter geojensis]MBM1709120.1 DUF3168 domain-containing protein [Sulfitobacter geojensis]MBM1713185.1 DUF3168 domain-containing protein [Sulfitobacter geojensis]
MNEPSLTFQTAIRTTLLTAPRVTVLVDTNNIRAGSTRPEKFPTIILAAPQTIHLGRTGSGYLTRVFLDLHIWAIEDGADMARQIGHAASVALFDPPDRLAVANVDDYVRPSFRYMRDPDPDRAYCHGVANVSGIVRWTV